jgi:hypothetical protein
MSLLLSKATQFDELAALSDLYVPAAQTYIGDYPYLHRDGIENLLAEDEDIWNASQYDAGGSGDDENLRESGNDDRVVEDYNEPELCTDKETAQGSSNKKLEWQASDRYESDNDDEMNGSDSWENPQTVSVRPHGRRARRALDEDGYNDCY